MGAHTTTEYPELQQLTASQIESLLSVSRLSALDREIAVQRLVWRMPYIDIAVAHNYDRSTVSKRMRNIIAPHLIELNNIKLAKTA